MTQKQKMKVNTSKYGIENRNGEYATKSGAKVLKAADLGRVGAIIPATVLGATEIDFGEEEKIVLELQVKGKEGAQGMALNKTNLAAMLNAFGDDVDEWTGKTIELRVESTQFKGQKTECIRVYSRK